MTAASLDKSEIAKFARLAADWWDPKGPLAPLHKMNPVRLAFLRQRILAHFGRSPAGRRPLAGLTMVDLGCGAGLVTEPLARLGAAITGLDGGVETIAAAQSHAESAGLEIDYRQSDAETLAAEGLRFDVVLALEVIEHVADIAAFVKASTELAAPGGLIVFSTINRTLEARALAVFAAERILGWAEPGTHDFDKLVKPEELAALLLPLEIEGPFGLSFDPVQRRWALSGDSRMNYFMLAKKPA